MMVDGGQAVTACGLATMDCEYDVERAPGPDEKVRARDVELRVGGPAARAAATAARLGADSRLVTCLGDSPIEEWITTRLRGAGVGVHVVGRPRTVPVASVVVARERGTRAVTAAIDPAPALAADVDRRAAAAIAGCGCVLVDGHYPRLAEALTVAARQARVPVLVDAGSWRDDLAPVLARADMVIAGEPFARDMGGVDVAIAAVRGLGVRWVAVTRGPSPIRWDGPSGGGEVPVEQVDARNTNGAGDVFHGAAAVAVGRRGAPESAPAFLAILRAAAFVAGVAVTHDDGLDGVDGRALARFDSLLT